MVAGREVSGSGGRASRVGRSGGGRHSYRLSRKASAWNPPHPRRPPRIAELRDRRTVQVTRGNTTGVHPAAQTTRHRQHARDRGGGITPLCQPAAVPLEKRSHLARLPTPSSHDQPPFPEHPAPTTEASARPRNYADPTARQPRHASPQPTAFTSRPATIGIVPGSA
jgi:hypothetical protein